MGWIDAELALVALAAMMSPTTLSLSVPALMVGEIAAVILLLLAAAPLRNGISGLTS